MVKKGLLTFPSTPSIAATGVTAGPLEKKSPFQAGFDKIFEDERCGMETNEQGHAKLMEDACMIALSKVDKIPADADFLLTGDLVNQMTPSSFFATTVGIPYIGMFSACATSVSSLLLAALLTEARMSKLAIAGSSSQHNAIERQFRYPIEYGAQKGDTAQWTVTAAGAAAVVPFQKGVPSIERGTIGKAIDMGIDRSIEYGSRHGAGSGRYAEAAFARSWNVGKRLRFDHDWGLGKSRLFNFSGARQKSRDKRHEKLQ